MSFGKDEVVSQPPATTNRIFITVPEIQYQALQRKAWELEAALLEIRRLIFRNHQLWVENGRPEGSHPGPIIAAILQVAQGVTK